MLFDPVSDLLILTFIACSHPLHLLGISVCVSVRPSVHPSIMCHSSINHAHPVAKEITVLVFIIINAEFFSAALAEYQPKSKQDPVAKGTDGAVRAAAGVV